MLIHGIGLKCELAIYLFEAQKLALLQKYQILLFQFEPVMQNINLIFQKLVSEKNGKADEGVHDICVPIMNRNCHSPVLSVRAELLERAVHYGGP